jgi:hypothetical protein
LARCWLYSRKIEAQVASGAPETRSIIDPRPLGRSIVKAANIKGE